MADYYELFSVQLPIKEREQRQWLMRAFKAREDDGIASIKNEGRRGIWIYSEENYDQDSLVDVLCEFQRRFNRTDSITISIASTCSKPTLDAFGGYALIFKYGQCKSVRLDAMIRRVERAMKPGKGGPRGGAAR